LTDALERLAVRKTYKLYIGGAFPRSESGRTYPVLSSTGQLLAHAAQASRKDLRDSVVAARKAFPGWSAATAYNRGQVLYRIAEMLEGRSDQFAAEISAAEGVSITAATTTVAAAVDRWVWYAGWADKYAQVMGSSNPVSGPYFNFSLPEPTGVVGVFAPQDSSFLGLASVIAPVIATGNTAVVVTSELRPPWLAGHRDVNALDVTGLDPAARIAVQQAAADSVKRVYVPRNAPDWAADPGIGRLTSFVEIKTVWHPIGV
jgi:delta 1-pyrroline-5-carboxylate dehydrogenase